MQTFPLPISSLVSCLLSLAFCLLQCCQRIGGTRLTPPRKRRGFHPVVYLNKSISVCPADTRKPSFQPDGNPLHAGRGMDLRPCGGDSEGRDAGTMAVIPAQAGIHDVDAIARLWAVILIPSPVILSVAKNPGISLRVNSAKDPGISSRGKPRRVCSPIRCPERHQIQGFFASLRSLQNDSTRSLDETPVSTCHIHFAIRRSPPLLVL